MQTYLFYDLETTGLNRAFDQALQFAAIRTDLALQEITRHEIRIKLRPDVVPSPEAMMAHGISIQQSLTGICEFEATQKIYALLNQPNTISLGYNSLAFDDKFLRFAFFRNLLPPYTHQYENNCRRMDLLPMVTVYWLVHHELLHWPESEGKVSLKLEDLNAVNHFVDGATHDAMVDTEICVELARKLSEVPPTWNYLTKFFDKKKDAERIEQLPPLSHTLPAEYKIGLLVSTEFGSKKRYLAPVAYLGKSIPYPNQSLWLRLDLSELQLSTETQISENTRVYRKRFGESGIILPPRERFFNRLDEDRKIIHRENVKWLEQNLNILSAIAKHHQNYTYPEIPEVDADAMLYPMGFWTDAEKSLCRKFHAAPLAKKIHLPSNYSNPLLQTLSKRIILRNYRDKYPDLFESEFVEVMRKVHPPPNQNPAIDHRGENKTTPASAMCKIDEMRKQPGMSRRELALLQELENYLRTHFKTDGDSTHFDFYNLLMDW